MPKFEKSKGFQLRSGNRSPFKEMGSSPVKQSLDFGTTRPVADDETAIDVSNTEGKDGIMSKMKKVGLEKLHTPKLSDKPLEPSKTFEETSAEIASEKKEAKKAKRKKFMKELGAGLEEAGTTISMAHGEGGTGSFMTANKKYHAMKAELKGQHLNNEWRANRNAKMEEGMLGGKADDGINGQDSITGTTEDALAQNIQKTDVSGVTKESDKKNKENFMGGYKRVEKPDYTKKDRDKYKNPDNSFMTVEQHKKKYGY